MRKIDRFLGCLVGGALGDALGYPVEFMTVKEIKNCYGLSGIREPLISRLDKTAHISDDTQMTLFTANGLLLAYNEGLTLPDALWIAYQRWYYTQMMRCADMSFIQRRAGDPLPFILDQQPLRACRAPGSTCLTELGNARKGAPGANLNDRKGCGGVMRVAPCGLFFAEHSDLAYDAGAIAAALTHGHPTGYTAAGALAMMIALIVGSNKTIRDAACTVSNIVRGLPDSAETVDAIDAALFYAGTQTPPQRAIEALGEGWIAEETLSIGLYCALKASTPKAALVMAVNHKGDSDSTGAVCGNIVGAYYGIDALPQDWIKTLELEGFIRVTAFELYNKSECKRKEYDDAEK